MAYPIILKEFLFPNCDFKGLYAGCLIFGSPHHQQLFANQAMELYCQKTCSRFVVSGHNTEATTIRDLMINLGIPSESIYVEPFASSTLENVVYSASCLNKYFNLEKSRALAVICKNYAARRCVLTIEKHLPVDSLYVKRVDLLAVDYESGNLSAAFIIKMLDEIAKIRFYSLKGDISNYQDTDSITLNNIEELLRIELKNQGEAI